MMVEMLTSARRPRAIPDDIFVHSSSVRFFFDVGSLQKLKLAYVYRSSSEALSLGYRGRNDQNGSPKWMVAKTDLSVSSYGSIEILFKILVISSNYVYLCN